MAVALQLAFVRFLAQVWTRLQATSTKVCRKFPQAPQSLNRRTDHEDPKGE